MEEYLKRLEDIIVPQNYNKHNFRDKMKAELEDPAEAERKMEALSRSRINQENVISSNNFNLNGEEENKLIDEYIQKMGVNEELGKSTGKVKIYEKILENEGVNEVVRGIKSSKTYSLSPSRTIRSIDESTLREKVHQLNLKSMNFRAEIESLKNTVSELKSKVEEKDEIIGKLERQKEKDNKYLLKMEGLLANKENGNNISVNKTKIISDKTLISNIHSKIHDGPNIDFNKTNQLIIEDKVNHTIHNFTDRNDLKEFVSNLTAENQKLKLFQNGVFDLSKKYDDVNENMIEGMKQIGNLINKNENILDDSSKRDVIGNFKLN